MNELSSNHMQHSKDETKIETYGSDYPVSTLDAVVIQDAPGDGIPTLTRPSINDIKKHIFCRFNPTF